MTQVGVFQKRSMRARAQTHPQLKAYLTGRDTTPHPLVTQPHPSWQAAGLTGRLAAGSAGYDGNVEE